MGWPWVRPPGIGCRVRVGRGGRVMLVVEDHDRDQRTCAWRLSNGRTLERTFPVRILRPGDLPESDRP